MESHWSPGGGFSCTVTRAGLSEKTVVWLCSCLEFMVNCNTQPVPGFIALTQSLCSYAGVQEDCPVVSSGSFACGEVISLLPKTFKLWPVPTFLRMQWCDCISVQIYGKSQHTTTTIGFCNRQPPSLIPDNITNLRSLCSAILSKTGVL